ncbi:hypothetical protein FUA23_15280 [Neolewinella aurantiaca]|uniref:Polysaccharide biosynthesis protein n=2 Tax=Neolewinella aurantiaca TaxID=2602767 RepID=A0A5C7FTZ9_9BACT|nr:hypothetical protein FUA23_15280 [Neolewinella aurantiaca]
MLGFGWLTGLLQAYLVQVRTIRPAEAAAFSRVAIVGVGLFSVCLLGFAGGMHELLFRVLSIGDGPPGWWYYFLFLLTQWPGLFFEQVLTIREKPLVLVLFSGLSALGFMLALLLPIYYGSGLTDALFVLATFAGVKGLIIGGWLIYDRFSLRGKEGEKSQALNGEKPSFPFSAITSLLSTAWPLILYASVGALVTAFDLWFVNYWYEGDESVFATFRYGARELPLLAAIINGAMVVVLPRLTEAPSAGLDLLKETSRRLFHWIFGGAIFLMATSGVWWTFVFTDLFVESLPLFQAYLFVVVSRLLFPMPVMIAMGRTKGLYLFSLSELLVKIVVCSIAAYYFGLVGIILSIVFADVSNKLILMLYVHYYMKIHPRRYMDVRFFLGYLALMILTYAFVIM